MLTKVSLLNSNLDFEHEKGGKIERMFTALMIYTFCFQLLTSAQAHMFLFFWRLGANWCCHDTDAYEERKRKEKTAKASERKQQ